MKAVVYSPGVAVIEIMGINFAMPRRLVKELISILQKVLEEMGEEVNG